MSGTAFTCPRCGRTSHNPHDIAEGYCGACHDWTGAHVFVVRPCRVCGAAVLCLPNTDAPVCSKHPTEAVNQ